jgi:light-regulated signal transduction histidine kinase (bacteriophytochrome)
MSRPQIAPSKSDREVSEFLLRACHDLRTSARTVRTNAELLLKDAASPRNSGFEQRLGFLVEGAARIDLLLDGLAAYSVALQTDAASFQATRMDVLLRLVLAKLDKQLRGCGAEVVYGELPAVTGNPDRLMQVFEILLRNALVHRGQASPRIRIDAARQAESWIFSVRDNGPGIEAAFLESVFTPFERLHNKERWGAGLGLSICRAIVERHGGRIWAESQPEGGATLCFTLPAD